MQVTETQLNPADGGEGNRQNGLLTTLKTEKIRVSGTAVSGRSRGVIRDLFFSISQFRCHPVPAPVSGGLFPEVAGWPSAHVSPSRLRSQEP